MGCLALKRKPCGVIAHVIDQDIEPEEWSEIYEALRNAKVLKKRKYRRTVSQYRALGGDQPRDSFQDEGVLLCLSDAKGLCKSGGGRMNVFASQSPEAEPLLELEKFGWSTESGLRLRNAKSGKLLMTLVPVQRPSHQRATALPQECRLPAIASEELVDTWELCRIYADGRVIASVRCGTEEEPSPPAPSCWGNIARSKGSKRQSFRVWVAAQGSVEANCSRCPSFKTDSSGHEMTWALSRGLGVSGFVKPEEVGGKKTELQKEVAEYWESIASAQRRWNETSLFEVDEGKASVDDRPVVISRSGEAVGIDEFLDRQQNVGVSGLKIETEESSLRPRDSVKGAVESTSTPVSRGRVTPTRRSEDLQAVKRQTEATHDSRRSLDSVEDFFECRSGRNSESGSETSVRELVAEGLLLSGHSVDHTLDGKTQSEPHLQSQSAELFQGNGESRKFQSKSSKYPSDGGCRADADRQMDDESNGDRVSDDHTEGPPLRRVGMLESLLSGQKSVLAKELERPLLSYRSSGLEFDPAADVRILEPQQFVSSDRLIPSAFITSAMVPLIVEVTRERFGRLEISFRSTSSSVRLGKTVVAFARGSGLACRKRMKLEVSAACSADALALAMLTKYFSDISDSVAK